MNTQIPQIIPHRNNTAGLQLTANLSEFPRLYMEILQLLSGGSFGYTNSPVNYPKLPVTINQVRRTATLYPIVTLHGNPDVIELTIPPNRTPINGEITYYIAAVSQASKNPWKLSANVIELITTDRLGGIQPWLDLSDEKRLELLGV